MYGSKAVPHVDVPDDLPARRLVELIAPDQDTQGDDNRTASSTLAILMSFLLFGPSERIYVVPFTEYLTS